jgi:hypothetical protein
MSFSKTHRLIAAVSVVAALASVQVGCGSGDEGTTKAEFIKRADSLCEGIDLRQDKARDRYWHTHPGFLGTAQFKRELWGWERNIVEEVTLRQIQLGANRLEALPAPSGDRKQVEAIVSGWREAVRWGLAHPIQLLWEGAAGPFAEARKLAREYGFTACAEPL